MLYARRHMRKVFHEYTSRTGRRMKRNTRLSNVRAGLANVSLPCSRFPLVPIDGYARRLIAVDSNILDLR